MKLDWTKGIKDPEEAKKVQESVRNCQKVLDILSEICYNSIVELEKTKISDYDSPSWSHKQAHKNGEIEALKRVIELCKLEKD